MSKREPQQVYFNSNILVLKSLKLYKKFLNGELNEKISASYSENFSVLMNMGKNYSFIIKYHDLIKKYLSENGIEVKRDKNLNYFIDEDSVPNEIGIIILDKLDKYSNHHFDFDGTIESKKKFVDWLISEYNNMAKNPAFGELKYKQDNV